MTRTVLCAALAAACVADTSPDVSGILLPTTEHGFRFDDMQSAPDGRLTRWQPNESARLVRIFVNGEGVYHEGVLAYSFPDNAPLTHSDPVYVGLQSNVPPFPLEPNREDILLITADAASPAQVIAEIQKWGPAAHTLLEVAAFNREDAPRTVRRPIHVAHAAAYVVLNADGAILVDDQLTGAQLQAPAVDAFDPDESLAQGRFSRHFVLSTDGRVTAQELVDTMTSLGGLTATPCVHVTTHAGRRGAAPLAPVGQRSSKAATEPSRTWENATFIELTPGWVPYKDRGVIATRSLDDTVCVTPIRPPTDVDAIRRHMDRAP